MTSVNSLFVPFGALVLALLFLAGVRLGTRLRDRRRLQRHEQEQAAAIRQQVFDDDQAVALRTRLLSR